MKNRKPIHDNWYTPSDFYESLNVKYHFDFDPCPRNPTFDGLSVDWGQRNFINPPYDLKLKTAFVLKALDESRKGKLCVMLLPVSTSTKLFHGVINPHATSIEFLKGRLKFEGVNTAGELVTTKCGQHDSMIVIFDGRKTKSIFKFWE